MIEVVLAARPWPPFRLRLPGGYHSSCRYGSEIARVDHMLLLLPLPGGPTDHRSELLAGFCTQFMSQQFAIGREAAAALGHVAFRQVRLDQRTLRALTQRFGADGHHRGLYRLSTPSQLHKPAAQGFQRMQQSLADALTLNECPVVIPPR